MSAILGIDPGLRGALALLTPGGLEIWDMPTLQITRNDKKRNTVDAVALGRLIDSISTRVDTAVVELVSGITGQSASAAFEFGRNVGILYGALAANFIPTEQVSPVKWKRAVGIKAPPKGERPAKDELRAAATRLMPAYAGLWTLVKHDGRAEAALIAHYWRSCR